MYRNHMLLNLRGRCCECRKPIDRTAEREDSSGFYCPECWENLLHDLQLAQSEDGRPPFHTPRGY